MVTDKSNETMRLALEALEKLNNTKSYWWQEVDEGVVVQLGNAETALRKALDKESLHKLATESLNEGLRLDDWPKIGCVNHDCAKCKAEQPAPVQGWRMVPVQPTDEMRDVGNVIIKDRGALFAAYRAMLDVAPQPAQQEPVGVKFNEGLWQEREALAEARQQDKGLGACPTSRTNDLEIKPNDRRTEKSNHYLGKDDSRIIQTGRGAEIHTGSAELGAHSSNPEQHEGVNNSSGPSAPARQQNEADDLIRNLGFDPEQFRTEAGFVNHMKLRAAIQHPDEYQAAMQPMYQRLTNCVACGRLNPTEGICNHGSEQPAQQQEPVGCQYAQDVAMPEYRCIGRCQYDTSPPAQRKPLTEAAASELIQQDSRMEDEWTAALALIRRTEAAHGIKENA